MKILVFGAGATGGYFGGRLAEAGADVTFLVRPRRAEQLARDGLVIESPLGDLRRPARAVLAEDLAPEHDVVLLACKAYDLEEAIATLGPRVGAACRVLPLLNGLAHLDRLDQAFGPERVLGGLCQIAATLSPDGVIRHLNRGHVLVYGERRPAQRAFCEALLPILARGRFDARHSDAILLEMWEKWVMLASLAAATCFARAPVGDIVEAPGGVAFVLGLVEEATQIARAAGHPPREKVLDNVRGLLTQRGSLFAASMLRDIEAGGRIEADHVIGDLIRRGQRAMIETPLLKLVYLQLKAYEAKRARLAA